MMSKILERKLGFINTANQVTTPTSELGLLGGAYEWLGNEVKQPWYLSFNHLRAQDAQGLLSNAKAHDAQAAGYCIIRNRGKDIRVVFGPKITDTSFAGTAKTNAAGINTTMYAEIVNHDPKTPTVMQVTTVEKKKGAENPNLNEQKVRDNTPSSTPTPTNKEITGNPANIGVDAVKPLVGNSMQDLLNSAKDAMPNGQVEITKYSPTSAQGQNNTTGTVLVDKTSLRLKAIGKIWSKGLSFPLIR